MLERKLDEALAKETKESMISWLIKKRIKNTIMKKGIDELSDYHGL